jgi:hypothetical protein
MGTARNSTPLDLSKLARLKELELGYSGSGVQWVTMTLRTAESINLEQIVIYFLECPTTESAYREWQDLDHLLLQFWISRSIRPKIRYKREEEGHHLGNLAPRLLPELTSRGAVDLIEIRGTYTTLRQTSGPNELLRR